MDALIARIEEGDSDLTILALTSECESSDQLDRLLQALDSGRHHVETIFFRESFFPLRRIREHLDRDDFIRMLHRVSMHATNTIRLPPTMLGMLLGRLACLTVTPLLRNLHADEAITFASDTDVVALAERLEECTQLESLQLGDSYFARNRPPSVDPILEAIAFKDSLTLLELSSHPEQRIKQPLLSTAGLESLLLTTELQLNTLNLSRMGLEDEHFGTISNALGQLTTLQWLCLDGNRPSRAGLEALVEALPSSNLFGLSLLETWNTDRIKWGRIFPANCSLQHLEIDHDYSTDVDEWLAMNRQGRSYWVQEGMALPLNLWPLVMEPISDYPSTLWFILQTFSESLMLAR
jgi:hypothetical protein